MALGSVATQKLSAEKFLHPNDFKRKIRAALTAPCEHRATKWCKCKKVCKHKTRKQCRCKGNVSRAAERLDVLPRQLWRWLKEFPALLNRVGHHNNPAFLEGTMPWEDSRAKKARRAAKAKKIAKEKAAKAANKAAKAAKAAKAVKAARKAAKIAKAAKVAKPAKKTDKPKQADFVPGSPSITAAETIRTLTEDSELPDGITYDGKHQAECLECGAIGGNVNCESCGMMPTHG